jgi:Protein of unknown function (DUF3501)
VKLVTREEVLDWATYDDERAARQEKVFEVKRPRRVHVGDHLTFLFENHETVLYQIQEMVRAEKIVRDAEIRHEIETYNEVLGKAGELGCVLLIEIDDPAERQEKLTLWLDLPGHLYVKLEGGRKVRATYDVRQMGETRVSSVQYIKFDTKGEVPVAVGVDHPDLTIESLLTDEQRRALEEDIR